MHTFIHIFYYSEVIEVMRELENIMKWKCEKCGLGCNSFSAKRRLSINKMLSDLHEKRLWLASMVDTKEIEKDGLSRKNQTIQYHPPSTPNVRTPSLSRAGFRNISHIRKPNEKLRGYNS